MIVVERVVYPRVTLLDDRLGAIWIEAARRDDLAKTKIALGNTWGNNLQP